MSQALRKITGALSNSNTTAIFINQLREKVGGRLRLARVHHGGSWRLKFYSSVRLDVRRIETLKQGTDAWAAAVRVKIVKKQVAAPFKQAELDLIWGTGFSREGGLHRIVSSRASSASPALGTPTRATSSAGQGERPWVPARQPRPRRRDREEDQGEARHRPASRRTRRRRARRLLSGR